MCNLRDTHTQIMVKESACEAVAHRYSLERESEFPVTTQSAHCSVLKAAGYQRCHLSPYLLSFAVNLICKEQQSYASRPGTNVCACLNNECHVSQKWKYKNLEKIKLSFHLSTGNPGVVGFYKTYMWTLYQTFIRRYPVWAVSHAGHCMPPETYDMIEGGTFSSLRKLHSHVDTNNCITVQYLLKV